MLESLDKLTKLIDDSTLIFPGHEYTLVNLNFGLYVLGEDDKPDFQERYEAVLTARQNRQPTCPETMAMQKRFNLFLRHNDDEVLKKLAEKTKTPEETLLQNRHLIFGLLRKLRDQVCRLKFEDLI